MTQTEISLVQGVPLTSLMKEWGDISFEELYKKVQERITPFFHIESVVNVKDDEGNEVSRLWSISEEMSLDEFVFETITELAGNLS